MFSFVPYHQGGISGASYMRRSVWGSFGAWFRLAVCGLTLIPLAPARAQQGDPGQALYFGGTTNDLFSVNVFTGFPTTAFTVEAWVWTSNLLKNGTVLSFAATGTAVDANEAALYNTRDLQPIVANLFANTQAVSVADGQWHHLAMTWTNSGEVRLYKDGALAVSSNGFRTGTVLRDFGSLVLGQDQDSFGGGFDGNQSLEGMLDEVRLWSEALPQTTIQSNLNLSLTGTMPGLVAYYRFDETNGLATSNSASVLNQGTLYGSTTNRRTSTAPVGLPPVISASHTGVWPVAATLQAAINPNGSATAWWFEWGPGTNLTQSTATSVLSAAYTTSLVASVVTGLPAGTSVTYRLCASNVTGLLRTPEATFTTPTNFVVATLADHVPGSLREAVAFARSNELITFSVSGDLFVTGHIVAAQSLTIQGSGPTNQIIQGAMSRLFLVETNATVNLEGLALAEGHAFSFNPASMDEKSGGAVLNYGTLALTNCILRGNRASDSFSAGGNSVMGGWGGALFNRGSLTLDRCAFYRNKAADASMSIFMAMPGQPGGKGGAIYSSGPLTAKACSFIGNQAGSGSFGQSDFMFGIPGYGGAGGDGGAIFMEAPLHLENCTLAANTAGNGGGGGNSSETPGICGPGGSGGAIYALDQVTLVNCTLAQNQTGTRGSPGEGQTGGHGGGLFAPSTTLTLLNTLIAGNSAVDGGSNPDLQGAVVSLGHNLIRIADGSSGLTNGVGGDQTGSMATPLEPFLSSLVYSTNSISGYLAPGFGSTALEGGDDVVLAPPYSLTQDGRGFARKSGVRVDIGSYETDASTFLQPSLQLAGVSDTTTHPAGATDAVFGGTIDPGTLPWRAYLEYGLTTAYGQRSPEFSSNGTNSIVLTNLVQGLLGGYTYHYRIVVSNNATTLYGPDQTYTPPAVVQPGDLDGDGVIAQPELDTVLSNYWANSPWLKITNAAGMGTSNLMFALPNPGGWSFTVEISSNLTTWTPAGEASPAYQFNDSAGTNAGTRYYRLVWP